MKKSIFLVFMALLMLITGCESVVPADENDITSDTDIEIGEEITIGGEVSEKPTTGHNVGVKCLSFYQEKTITLDVFMCQHYNSYDKLDGYPLFEVFVDTDAVATSTTKRKLKINGKKQSYKKKFKRDDLSFIYVDSKEQNVFDGHSEKVTLNFEKFEPGDTIYLMFSYGFFYYKDNPYSQTEPDNSCAYRRRNLFFYIGENGIGVASNTLDDAIANYEEGNKKLIEIGKEPGKGVMCTAKELYLKPLSGSLCKNQHGNCLVNLFRIISSEECEQYLIRITGSNGINIVGDTEYITSDDTVKIRYFLTDCSPYGTIEVEVCEIGTSEKNTFSKTIYCVSGTETDYSSTDSLGCLSEYSSDIKQLLTDAAKSGESGYIYHDAAPSAKYIPTYSVQGYIRWTDSVGTAHPARNVTVEIYGTNASNSSSWILDTVTTNDSGYYSATLTATGSAENVFIRVKSKGLNITVKDPYGTVYQYDSDVYYGLTDGNTAVISYTAGNLYDLGKSLCVHQAFELANRYIYTLENAYMSNIDISYPDDSQGTSCYYANKIYILEGDAFDWDVLEHEYGHYVQDCYNIENTPGGDHDSDDNLADSRGNKSEGIYLAWGEGWATYFAINQQNKMNASALGIPNVGDTSYQDTVDAHINYSIEYLPSSKRLGEANEATVAAVLYDITDPVNTSEEDNIYCNNGSIWAIIKNNNCSSLSQFLTAFYNSTFSMNTRLNLGTTLSRYKVAAKLNAPTGLSTSTPTFSWSKQGGSNNYPNNSFKLAFYDSSFEPIIVIDCGNVTSVTLTSSQWNLIRWTGVTVYCCIQTNQTAYPATGAYYSNLITINVQ